MGFLLASYLAGRTKLLLDNVRRVRIRLIDATHVSRPGSTEPDWRVHVGFDLGHLRCDHMELTKAKEGEGFKRFEAHSGEVLIGDRQYGHRGDVYSAVSAGADAIVRLAVNAIPFTDVDGVAFRMRDKVADLGEEEVLDMPVFTVPDKKNNIPAIAGRLIVKRKSRLDEEKTRAKLIKKKKKTGKKPTDGSLVGCGFIFLFTTLSPVVLARDVLELYRFRWQIEIALNG